MNVRDICAAHLTAAGFSGLYEADECACEVADLFPCGNSIGMLSDCEAGYVRRCDECPRTDNDCPLYMREPGGFCVGRTSDFPGPREAE